jgi:hypothetical protein|eukprot:COSAG02_NODE_2925_length_7733_cov_8.735918_8_plen_175_part_00
MDQRSDTVQPEDVWNRPRTDESSRPSTTPAERKQRRLESNRAAAKRAYYRRQDKVQSLQLENEHLKQAAVEHRFKISIYESLLRRLGVDPNVAVEAIRGSAKPVLVPAPQAKSELVDKQLQQQPHNDEPSTSADTHQTCAALPSREPALQPLAVAQPGASGPVQGIPPVDPSSF